MPRRFVLTDGRLARGLDLARLGVVSRAGGRRSGTGVRQADSVKISSRAGLLIVARHQDQDERAPMASHPERDFEVRA